MQRTPHAALEQDGARSRSNLGRVRQAHAVHPLHDQHPFCAELGQHARRPYLSREVRAASAAARVRRAEPLDGVSFLAVVELAEDVSDELVDDADDVRSEPENVPKRERDASQDGRVKRDGLRQKRPLDLHRHRRAAFDGEVRAVHHRQARGGDGYFR